jgi:hypothetical protein
MKKKFTRTVMTQVALATIFAVVLFSCKKNDIPKADRPYDLDVVLHGGAKNPVSSGFIKFRQNPDTARIIDLDTWISHLEPNHAYQLQRAVNPIADTTGCSSTAWLTLGLGLTPQSIHTDEHGNGNADLWRNVSSVARGTSFHIHFQIIDSASTAVVLTSGCYDYTIR